MKERGGARRGYISSDWTSEFESVEIAAFECVMELGSMTGTYGVVKRPFVYHWCTGVLVNKNLRHETFWRGIKRCALAICPPLERRIRGITLGIVWDGVVKTRRNILWLCRNECRQRRRRECIVPKAHVDWRHGGTVSVCQTRAV